MMKSCINTDFYGIIKLRTKQPKKEYYYAAKHKRNSNGPENSSRRTQFMKRILEFSAQYNIKVILSYYPPHHSKYNPIERIWGRLEQHWNSNILDSKEAVLGFAKSMTWKGSHPFVKIVDAIYETGKKVEKEIMEIYESAIDRDLRIGKWFITISPKKITKLLNMPLKV